MTKAFSRRYRDLDAEARRAARAEARRSGKRLGAWLDEAGDEPYDDEDEDFGEDVEAVARRLARPSGPAESRRRREDENQPRRWRDDVKNYGRRGGRSEPDDPPRRRRDDDVRDARDDADEQPRRWRDDVQQPRRRREDREPDQPRRWLDEEDAPNRRRDVRAVMDDDERVPHRRRELRADPDDDDRAPRRMRAARREIEELIDLQEIVADTAEIVGRRIAKSERHTARALDNLAELVEDGARSRETAEEGLAFLARRLGRIESRLAEQSAASDSVKPIRTALARLETRLERLSGPERVLHVEEALSGLDRRLSDIARRLDTPPPRERPVAPPPEAPPAALHAPEPAFTPAPAAVQAPAHTPAPAPAPAAAPVRPEPPRRAEAFARRPLEESIAEITRRQRALEAAEAPAPATTRPPAPQPAAGLPTAPPPVRMEASDFAPPPRQFADVQSRLEAISRQIDTARRDAAERADHHLVVMRQIEALRRDLTEMSGAIVELAPRASIGAIETALRELSRRIDTQRGQGVAAELLAPAERIAAELRNAIKELDPSPLVRNLHADVQTIGRRLDALQQPGAVDPVAIDLLVSQTRDIRAQLAGLAARPLPLEKIEARLVDLNQRVELLARAGGGAAKAAVALDMGEVARSIRAIVAEETSSSFDTFSGRLETLAARLDAVVSDAGGAQRFDELGRRIDDLGHKLATRIAAAAATQAPRPNSAALEALVAGLARKLDTALEQKPQAPVIEEIGRKLDALETRLPDANAIDSIARIEAALASRTAEQDFADLAQRIDDVRETLAQKLDRNDTVQRPDVGAVERLVRGLDHKVDTALATGASARDIAPILSQLEQLTRKVDLLDDPVGNPRLGALLGAPAAHPKLDEIATRLDHMQVSLAHRAEEGARVEARQAELTDLVEQLAAGISQAAESRGDIEAIRALERQIGALSQRLDRNDHNGAALTAVEAKIGALVAHIEESRTATTLAAEEAVRRATQEMLRETSPDADALRAAIERELADIRNIQDENGQRTHETLLAVHETLERVVDRLAIFEDELSELRATPPVTPPVAPPVTPPKPMAAERTPEPAIERRPPRLPAEALAESIDLLGPAQSPRRATIVEAPPERGAEPVQMDFIAAARRAAQQAARDAQAAERAHLARRAAATVAQDGEEASTGKAAGLIAAIQERKRPLLLGLGAMVLMVGAYQVARIGIDGADSWRQEQKQEHQHAEIAPGDGVEPTAPAEKTDRPAPKQSIAPPDAETGKPARPQAAAPTPAPTPAPRMILPQGGNQPVDKTPVGSIGTGGLNPLPPPQQDAAIRTLAEQGNPAAQFELAVRLAEGRGVPRDPKLAAQWFEKAAAQGLAPAQYRLGSLYEKGVGVERDQARARKLYLSAAEAGNARAMHNLAVMLAEVGLDGKPDYAAASEWFRRGGEAGVRDSQYNLAILYARGLGVKQSLVQSYVWFAAAAAQGDPDADKKREEVGARLDSKELAAAKAAAAAFRVKEAPKQANEVAAPFGGWENVRLPASAPKPGPKPKVSTL